MSSKFRFTKKALEDLCSSEKDIIYHDIHHDGYGLKMKVTPAGKKVFLTIRKLDGKPKKITLGGFPSMSIEKARKESRKAMQHLMSGEDPNAIKRADQSRMVTLEHCLSDYVEAATIKASTAKAYKRTIEQFLPDWTAKPLVKISRNDIEARFKKISKASPTRANTCFRILRALFNFAGKYEDESGNPIILHNPVDRLRHVKAWNKETRKTTYIKLQDLPIWYRAVETLPEWEVSANSNAATIRDYLLLILFTGLRRREADRIKWEHIDFYEKTLTIPDTKNDREHTLPLPDYLMSLLQSRSNNSPFVFPGDGNEGHLVEPKRVVAKVRDKTGVYFTLHDLRRTFITIAERLDIRDYTLKRLLNHKNKGDVTEGYIIMEVERLREPMQRIADFIINVVSESDNIVQMEPYQTKRSATQ